MTTREDKVRRTMSGSDKRVNHKEAGGAGRAVVVMSLVCGWSWTSPPALFKYRGSELTLVHVSLFTAFPPQGYKLTAQLIYNFSCLNNFWTPLKVLTIKKSFAILKRKVTSNVTTTFQTFVTISITSLYFIVFYYSVTFQHCVWLPLGSSYLLAFSIASFRGTQFMFTFLFL